jgi:ketosteroid isomerase-like protein
MRRWHCVSMALVLCLSARLAAQTPPTTAVNDSAALATHQALRDLKVRLVAAVNARDTDALVKDLHPQIWFTAMNNETFHGISGAQQYWARMMVGASRVVDSLSLTADTDSLSVLLPNGSALSTGTSIAHFKLKTGTQFDVPLRWSATLVNTAGAWQVANIHFSANVFENPVSGSVTRVAMPLVALAGVFGIGVGWLFGRTRRTPS